MFLLVRIMLLYGCSFLGFFRCLLRGFLRKNIAMLGGMRDGSYTESEACDPASVVLIHTGSELSSDSDSTSVASVN